MVVSGARSEGGNFYRYLFAALCFSFLAAGILMHSAVSFLLVLLFGALSRTATKRSWPDPTFAEKIAAYCDSLIDGGSRSR